MKSTGRPKLKPVKLMDGFYIEVTNKGSDHRGLKIRNESKAEMDRAAVEYARHKDVIILGEFKDGIRV